MTWCNVNSLEYKYIPNLFFTPHHVGRVCINVIQGHCCVLGYSCTNVTPDDCCATMETLGSNCCAKMCSKNGALPLLRKKRQTEDRDMEGQIRRSSLTLEREQHLQRVLMTNLLVCIVLARFAHNRYAKI